ncbi:hypothetical protein AGROH133_04254 [Agrobacterium tumefaciens]|nr:hypothetical protein AGROH133_04254 [Agrobacterium tumefaciens]
MKASFPVIPARNGRQEIRLRENVIALLFPMIKNDAI